MKAHNYIIKSLWCLEMWDKCGSYSVLKTDAITFVTNIFKRILFSFYLKVDTNASEWTIKDWAVLSTGLTGKTTTGLFCTVSWGQYHVEILLIEWNEFSLQRCFSQTRPCDSVYKYVDNEIIILFSS